MLQLTNRARGIEMSEKKSNRAKKHVVTIQEFLTQRDRVFIQKKGKLSNEFRKDFENMRTITEEDLKFRVQ